MRALCIVVALVVARATPAFAHQTSVKYVTLTVAGTDHTIAVTFKVAPGDLTEPLGLPADARPSAAAAAASPAVAPYVAHWLAIGSRDQPCPATTPRAAVDTDARFVVVTWSASCPAAISALTLDFAGFFAVDHQHVAVLRLASPDRAAIDTIVRVSDSPLTLRLDDRSASSFPAWIAAGIAHIWQGVDHIAFVLALLLIVMLARTDGAAGAAGAAWTLRAPLASLRRTAGVITAFTIAHSISLALASLGILVLPGRFVEIAIAASIVFTAAEDIVRPDTRSRFVVTFLFGLVHGLGFASVLAELLPPTDVALPLVGFNLGVEVGQLAIVVGVLPILYALAYVLGADRYRRVALPILASAILALGLVFLLERVAGLHITGV